MVERDHDREKRCPAPRTTRQALGRPVRRRPEPELEALSRSHPLRLAARAATTSPGRGRTPACCTRPACSPTTSCAALLARHRRARRAASRRVSCSPQPADEDVHGALERLLVEQVGPDLGGKLRAGRSPATTRSPRCSRCSCATTPGSIAGLVLDLVDALADQAEQHLGAIMPGRTHLQHAQPVLLSHHLLAHAWPLVRDVERLRDWDARVAADSPYGSGALAGSQPRPRPGGGGRATSASPARAPNSIDGTAARDFVAEFAFVTAMIGVDVSRLAEEVILWATSEFGFVDARRRLLDRVEHHAAEEEPRHRRAGPRQGRPADRQPDRAAGHAQGAAAGLQPRPAGGQGAGLRLRRHPRGAAAGVHRAWSRRCAFDTERMAELAPQGFSLATDIAEWLVREGVPFRVAHEVAGACVRRCEERGIELHELTDERVRRDRPAPDAGGPRGAHRRGLGRLARRPRRHRAGPGRASSSPSCAAAISDHRGWLALTCSVLARPAARGRAAPARRDAAATATSRSGSPRSRRTTARRPRLPRLPRPHRAQRGHVRPGRPPLRLLHLRHAPLRQRRHRARRRGRRGPAARRRGRRRLAARHAAIRATRARPRLCRPWASTWTTTAPTSLGRSRLGDPVGARQHRPARRPAPRADRPWRFWLTGDPTVGVPPATPADVRRESMRRHPASASW